MGDPVQSIISIFVGTCLSLILKIKDYHFIPTRTDNVEIHPQTKEIYRVHPQFVKRYSLEEYVRGGQDWFMTYEHIYNWTQRKTKYPVLCVKSDVQWKYGKEIFVDFLGQEKVPEQYVQRDRNSTIDLIPDDMKDEFTSILKDATELYNSLPEFHIK